MSEKSWMDRFREWNDRHLDALVRRIRQERPPDVKAIIEKIRRQPVQDHLEHFIRVNDFQDTVKVLEEKLTAPSSWGVPRIAHKDLHEIQFMPMRGDDGVYWTFTVPHKETGDELLITLGHIFNPTFIEDRRHQVIFSVIRRNERQKVSSLWVLGTHEPFEHRVMKGGSYSTRADHTGPLKTLIRLLSTWSDNNLPIEMGRSQQLTQDRIRRREQARIQIKNGIEIV